MAKSSITVKLNLYGGWETLRAFRALPKEANNELRDKSQELSKLLADRARADGMSDEAPQSRLVASTVKAVRDRTPAVQAGGTRRLGRRKVPAYKLLFGSMFGSDEYTQFGRPHGGSDAYWFFPVVEQQSDDISRAWLDVADEILERYEGG